MTTLTPMNLNIQLPSYSKPKQNDKKTKICEKNNKAQKIVLECNYSNSLEIDKDSCAFTPDSESACSDADVNDKDLREVFNMCNFACAERSIDQIELADSLVGYFNKRNVKNMFYSNVLCYLSKQFSSKDMEIDYTIKSWCQRDSRWLQIVKDGDLIYLRLNNRFDYNRLLKKKYN